MLQHSRLPAQLTRSCMSSGRRCLTCDTANPFLKAFRSSCTLSFRCFCELEHACSAHWWIHVITYGCTQVLLTLPLKIRDCLSIVLNQDPQAFSHAQANLGIGAPYCSPPPLGMESRLGTARTTAANRVLISPRKSCSPPKWDTWKQIVMLDRAQSVCLVNPVLDSWSACRWEFIKAHVPARNLQGTAECGVYLCRNPLCRSSGAQSPSWLSQVLMQGWFVGVLGKCARLHVFIMLIQTH